MLIDWLRYDQGKFEPTLWCTSGEILLGFKNLTYSQTRAVLQWLIVFWGWNNCIQSVCWTGQHQHGKSCFAKLSSVRALNMQRCYHRTLLRYDWYSHCLRPSARHGVVWFHQLVIWSRMIMIGACYMIKPACYMIKGMIMIGVMNDICLSCILNQINSSQGSFCSTVPYIWINNKR